MNPTDPLGILYDLTGIEIQDGGFQSSTNLNTYMSACRQDRRAI